MVEQYGGVVGWSWPRFQLTEATRVGTGAAGELEPPL